MALQPGTRLGPYEIEVPLGAGGMGEVYRATDTRLDRTVAIKVLPEHVSENPRLRQRFDREARTLAGLSHPHICTLHDVGNERGIHFLVMELLEGETLAARLARGALPITEVLRVGAEIADALDAAHRHGVVHRDVKPGNVVLTKSGVKLVDFGLARDAAGMTEFSETATVHAPITVDGTIVGTLRYMSPEQLEGREADARSDLFSLGATLYEMTTGQPPFHGNSQAGLIATILTGKPAPIVERQPMTPRALARAVERCLAKDPDNRWQSARDLALELESIAERAPLEASPTPAAAHGPWRERIAWLLALALLVAVAGWATLRPDRSPRSADVTRLSVELPPATSSGFSGIFSRISPDGRKLVLSVLSEGHRSLWLRPLDSVSSRPLPGTDGAVSPFWSPDSRYVGFFADGKLKKVDVRSGAPLHLCDAPGSFSMGTWSSEGTVVFNVLEGPEYRGVYRVSDTGGAATRLTIRNDSDEELLCAWPSFLPDEQHLLLFCGGATGEETVHHGLYVVDLESGRARIVVTARSDRGFRGEYVAPGCLVYTREGSLVAQAFDADRFVVHGEPITIAERVESYGPFGLDNFSVSRDVLVYQTSTARSELVWKDRNGHTLGRVGSPAIYSDVNLGPDDRALAVTVVDRQTETSDLWVIDLDRDVPTRFTSEDSDEMAALWSPDGDRIVFSMSSDAPPFLHVKSVTTGDQRILLPSSGVLQVANDWSPDGRRLLYGERDPNTDWDLWVLPYGHDGEPVPFLKTPFSEMTASFAPDGRWVAYASDESGRMEVYVTSFPDAGRKHRVSTGGGYLPRWRRDGKELFYITFDGRMMAVPVTSSASFESENPIDLFSIEPGPYAILPYDVDPGGQRFIVISAVPGKTKTPTLVINWQAELTR